MYGPVRTVLLGGPSRHVGADFGEETERVVRPDAIDLGEVDARELVQRSPDIEARLVPLLLSAPSRGHGARGSRGGRGESGEVGLNGDVARRELLLIGVEEFEVLLEDEEALGAIVGRQGGDDLVLGRLTAAVPMLRELVRVALAGHDVAADAQGRSHR